MNTTYQRKENKPSSSQNLKLIYPEEKKSGVTNKTQENIQLREISLIPNDNYSPISTFKNDVTPINRPILKRSSFSDILAPHDLHTEVNLSLEKELERNVHKTLNTMPNKSK